MSVHMVFASNIHHACHGSDVRINIGILICTYTQLYIYIYTHIPTYLPSQLMHASLQALAHARVYKCV